MGTGLGSYFEALYNYGIGYSWFSPYKDLFNVRWGIHNLFISILVEGGIFSFFAFIRFLFLQIKTSTKILDLKFISNKQKTLTIYSNLIFISTLLIPANIHTAIFYYEFLTFLSVLVAIANHFLANIIRKKVLL